MVTNELLSHGEVFVNGDAIRARQVANQIALRDAVEKYGVSKVFTFHKTVASAASFVADGSEGVRTHLPDFKTFHVNGSMSTARREHEMRDFRAAARAVVSNARCLTEGVDVPAVDMVAFLSPRRSRVDIVQATGRAMRRSPGKTTGYVLVPLYVELTAGETVEAAVNRAEFNEVWDVLHSIQEQDDALSELIRYFGEQKGRGKGFDDSRFTDRIDFGGSRLDLEALRAAVATHCLENLCSSWDISFGKLKAFKERFGHCNVDTGWEEDPALNGWASAQRTRRNKGSLHADRIKLLDELGFVWDFQTQKVQETWMNWYHELEKYTSEHGNPHVPRTHDNTRLASWVWGQRQRRKGTSGKADDPMTPEQVHLLNKLGFRWDANEEKWSERFEQLKRFKEQHGHCDVEQVEDESSELSRWVTTQRKQNVSGELQSERKVKLDAFDFKWAADSNDMRWQEMYEQLKQYHKAHGDSDVPYRSKKHRKLATWVVTQRARKKQGDISDEQTHLLDELGFTWESRDRGTWEDRLAEVAAFKAKHGHCDIPMSFSENPKLGRFINNMRVQRNAGKLSADRVAKLEAVGFIWKSARRVEVAEGVTVKWMASFNELLQYKKTHGNFDVPVERSENPALGKWVGEQRFRKLKGKLNPAREKLLNEISFNFVKTRKHLGQ
jgi:hypothetical protein